MPFAMLEALPVPVVLVPGLTCSPRLYAEQIPALWRFGPVTVADPRRDDSVAAIARRISASAPPRFRSLACRWAVTSLLRSCGKRPERVAKLALLDTGARGETPEQTERRKVVVALAKAGRYAEVADIAFPIYVHRNRHQDETLKRVVRAMAEDTGVEAFLRQQQAIMSRPDSRPRSGRSDAQRWFSSAMTIRPRHPIFRVRSPPAFPERDWS